MARSLPRQGKRLGFILLRGMKLALALSATGVALLFGSGASDAAGDTTVTLLFTNNSDGKLVDCSCRNDPFGGLAERVSFVRAYRSAHPDAILLDSGGYFGFSDIDRKAPIIIRLMKMMRYDAAGAGDQELYRGLGPFLALAGGFRSRILSASLRTGDRKPVFAPYRIFTVGAVRIAVIGIAGPETFASLPKESIDFLCDPPEEAIARILPEARKNANWVIVLSQLGVKADQTLAAKFLGIDLIIGGHSKTLLERELTVSGVRIVQAGMGGGRVGEVTVTFDGARREKEFSYRLIDIDDRYPVPGDVRAIVDAVR
jgi:5'-nucleotidase / UDP-sugar diphosphatase